MPDPSGKRILEWTTIGSLLLVLVGIPLSQAIREALSGTVPHIFRLFSTAPTKKALHAWDQESSDRLAIAKAIRSRVLETQFDLFGDAGAKAIRGKGDWLFYRPDVEYLFEPDFRDERFYLGTFDTIVAGGHENLRDPLVAIRDVHRQLAARGIRLLVVPIPGKPGIYPEKLSGPEVSIENSPTLVLIDSLRKSGIDAVDLVHALRLSKSGPSDLYLHRDTHWSPAGVEVASALISKSLLEYPEVLAGRNPSRYGLRDTAVERWGDIAEMTALPDRHSIWTSERIAAHQVVDASGSPYRDSAGAAVLWLGDSFSRIYETDAPGSAGIIAQVARRIGQPLASVVNDGGASTVVRIQLSRKPELLASAKVVVWTFVERDIRSGEMGWKLVPLP
jgi:SAM-dependent methyltransferase